MFVCVCVCEREREKGEGVRLFLFDKSDGGGSGGFFVAEKKRGTVPRSSESRGCHRTVTGPNESQRRLSSEGEDVQPL